MKKFFVSVVLIFSLMPFAIVNAQNIEVLLNGERITFDQQPFVENGRALVPMRAIFEALGADVYWFEDGQAIIAVKNEIKINLVIGDTKLEKINIPVNSTIDDIAEIFSNDDNWEEDGEIELDVPPQIVNGRTMVPLRAISEALDIDVAWDGNTNAVYLKCSDDYIKNKNNDTDFINKLLSYYEQNKIDKNNRIKGDLELVDADGNIVINKNDIILAKVCYGSIGTNGQDEYYLEVYLTDEGIDKRANATGRIVKDTNGRNYISIMVEGSLISRPTVKTQILSSTFIITGSFNQETADDLASLINNGFIE